MGAGAVGCAVGADFLGGGMSLTQRTKQTEAEVKTSIRATLQVLGAFEYRPPQGIGAVKGLPDFICCLEGKFIGIEAKKSDWKPPSPGDQKKYRHHMHQVKIHHRIRNAGGIAFFCRSKDELIEKLGVQDRFIDTRRFGVQ